jgi:hypothetical protein
MPILSTEYQFQSFREQLYSQFEYRADSAMDLLDALCSNDHAPSVVELSLNPLFRRDYTSLFKVIGESLALSLPEGGEPKPKENLSKLIELIAQTVPIPEQRPFYLFGLDCTSCPRLFAPTLEDRGMVYHPTPLKGNKPITIGHSYSMLAGLPERQEEDAPWTIPMEMSRVPSELSSATVGQSQVKAVLGNPNVPWFNELCVLDVDSAYGNKIFLGPLRKEENLVIVSRIRSNRVFFQSPVLSADSSGRGHPTWYGERFDLKDEKTWHQPNEVAHTTYQTRRGQRTIEVTISAWHNLLMRGSKDIPMHECPFTLLRIESMDESGQSVFRPMWLIVMGARRDELSPVQAFEAYRQRFDLEHSFRFTKQNLLLTTFETSDVEHEERWVQFVMLAYVQLWAAHFLAVALPRPWERYLKTHPSARISPSKVQQDWARIISQLGTPAVEPKPRGKSSGRQFGQTQTPRPRLPVVKQGISLTPNPEKAA